MVGAERIIKAYIVNILLTGLKKCIQDSKISPSPQTMTFSGVLSDTDSQNSDMLKEMYAGHAFGSVPPSSNEFSSKCGVFGKVCRLDRLCMADEVHLRRFDGLLENDGSHRCVVASITVKILLRDSSKEGCKGLLYMVLHARVVLDLHEKLEEEISFAQVEEDFDSFQGKWLLEQLGGHHTLLKYSVESKMYIDTFLSEVIVEEVVYEDLPSNLCAIRDFVENRVTAMNDPPNKAMSPAKDGVYVTENMLNENFSSLSSSNPLKHRRKVPGLQKDLDVLKAEIVRFISKYGQ